MNKQEIYASVVAYANKKYPCKDKYDLYQPYPGIYQFTDKIDFDNFIEILLGGNFLTDSTLIIPLLPFLQLQDSSQFKALLTTYNWHFSQNHQDLFCLLENNTSLLQSCSLINKEIYCLVKKIAPDEKDKMSLMFNNDIYHIGDLIEKTQSITYNIDINHLIHKLLVPDFNLVINVLLNSLSELSNQSLCQQLEANSLLFDCNDNERIVHIIFVDIKNEKLIDMFMDNFFEYFVQNVKAMNNPSFTTEELSKVIYYTKMNEQLSMHKNTSHGIKI